MKYSYLPNDPNRYATNLRRDSLTKNLLWDSARGQDVLIIQTPFGHNPVDNMSEVCEALEKTQFDAGGFTEILRGVRARIVTSADKVKLGGCNKISEACTYTVFSIIREGDCCRIFAPQVSAMISARCDIPMELRVCISPVTRIEGFLKKKEVPTGFLSLSFPADFNNSYTDGYVCCKTQDIEIPITRKMLENQVIYIKEEAKPELYSTNKGLKLIIDKHG